ncbi:trypsin-like peptidase domain-containing protein [Streptomyces sp. NPDC052012]|uniref:nSTAND1 domain-containing NTPase n=1 Tax=Streptomyces sp. NPDC052012 TaxID=3155051 RepID=UPI00344E7017
MTGQDTAHGTRPPQFGADQLPAAGVVRISGEDGFLGGAGCLVTEDLVLTCAHVVADALDRPRDEAVAVGTTVRVAFPLATAGGGEDPGVAEVVHWVPIRADRTGDLAVLRLRGPAPGGARPLPMAWPKDLWNHRARAVGFTGGEPSEIWFRGRLGGRTSEGWLQLSRADGQTTHVREGFSGGPVWDDELDAVVGLVVAAQVGPDAQAFVLHTETVLRELPGLVPVLDPPSPFRGLVTYEEDDEDVYFGRAGDIDEVVTALSGPCASVTLYGPSGCGKSSLARAGVLPRMRRDGYEVLVVDAGKVSSPRAALAVELWEAVRDAPRGPQRAGGVDEVERMLAAYGLGDTLHRLRGRRSGRLLVLLDQAEALLDRTETEVAEAVELLFPQRPGPGPRVLVTLRADFMDAVLRHPLLGPALRGGRTLPLTPMSRAQLEEVITKPVARIPSVDYDPGLVRRLLDDAGSEPGVLPLLGFVLRTLWERRAGGRLLTTAYEEMGGVLGALRRHADRVWAECVGGPGAAEAEAEALALLTGLVRVLPGSETPLRRRLTRQEAGEVRWALARDFAERRLLVLHGDQGEPESAELAHEALITVWDRLRDRIAEDGQFLAARAELAHDLDRWTRGQQSPDLLPGPVQLGVLESRLAQREDELTAAERDFLTRARRRRRAARTRARTAWTAVALVLALVAGLGTFLVYQSHISEERDAQAKSRALAVLSDEQATRDPGLASLAAIAAYDTSPTHEARSALLRRYEALKEAAWMLSGAEGKIRGVATSGDGAVTLVTTERGRATLFVRRPTGAVVRTHLRLAVNAVVPLVSRDGRRIAYLSSRQNTVSWHEVDPSAGRVLGPRRTVRAAGFRNPERVENTEVSPTGTAGFSPDARRVATVSDDGRLWLWDLDRGRARRLPAQPRHAHGVSFGPDGDTLVAQLQDPGETSVAVAAVDLGTGRARTLARDVALSAEVAQSALSGDGRVLAVCRGASGGEPVVYRAVRVADGRELVRHRPDSEFLCGHVAVDRTGSLIAVHHGGSRWTLLGTSEDATPKEMTGPFFGHATGLPLLGSRDTPVALVWDASAVVARPMHTDVFDVVGPPVLIDDGDRMLAHQGDHGERLTLADTRELTTGGRLRVLRRVAREASKAPLTGPPPRMQVNDSETLLADLVTGDKVVIRSLPSLRRVAEITIAPPPPAQPGTDATPFFGFLDDDELLTVSGSRIEQWNARNGLRLEKTIDARELGLSEQPSPRFFVRAHPEPGHLLVHVQGRPTVHAVDRRTGRENRSLRVRFGDDFIAGGFTGDGRHALVATMGGLYEGWSVTGGTARRVLGPLGPALRGDQSQLRPVGDTGYVVANGTSVRFIHFDDLDRLDSYDFSQEQVFFSLSGDGRTVLRQVEGGGMDVFRLDPALWRRHLCAVLGRDLSEDERRGLPSEPGRRVCPQRL